jgi:hypothetical protein
MHFQLAKELGGLDGVKHLGPCATPEKVERFVWDDSPKLDRARVEAMAVKRGATGAAARSVPVEREVGEDDDDE